MGTIVAKGADVKNHNVGDAVAVTGEIFSIGLISGNGCYSEYSIVNARKAIPVGICAPEVLPLMVSGLTASLGLEKAGEMKSNETVLITGLDHMRK